MGFLDRVSKALDGVRDAAARVEQAAATQADAPAPVPGAEPSGLDSGDPRRWLSVADVTAIAGVAVGEPTEIEDADTYGVRFTGSTADGELAFEIRSLREEVVGRYGGSPSGWIDEQAARFERRWPIDGFADYAVGAADGDGSASCFVWCADSCFTASATGPGDLTRVPEALLRHLYDWPEEPEA